MNIEVRPCTVAELEAAPNLAELISEYAQESSALELGPPNPQLEIYRAMEQNGHMHPIAAFVEGRLAGFVLPVVITLPHFGVTAASAESFFVARDSRHYGLGEALRARTRQLGRDLGAKALLLSAPPGSDFQKVLEASKRTRLIHVTYIEALA